MSITLTSLMQQRRDTAANWTSNNPTLLNGEIGWETDTGYLKIGDGSTAWTSLGYIDATKVSTYPLATVDIANDAVTADKLADTAVTAGSYTAANITVDAQGRITAAASGTIGTSEIADNAVNGDKLADDITIANDLTVTNNLTVNGTTTTINSTTLQVDDKNIELGTVETPSDTTADGGGITLKGATDHTIIWTNSTDSWDFSEHVNIASGKEFRIGGTKVLDATSLGSSVVSSSLTSVGTIGTGVWNGTPIATDYIADDGVTADKLAHTTVTAGSYTAASITVDAQGRLTSASSTTATDNNFTTALKNKLDGIESGATADQTASEIRTLVDSATDSNVFTDADHTKLDGIATGATNVTNNNQLTNGAGYITSTISSTAPQLVFDESDTSTRARFVVTGGNFYIQAGLAGGDSSGSGDLYFSGYNGVDIGAFQVRSGSAWHDIWHAGNDGSGSGLDADTLDGAQPSASASNSTIVQRHSSGYIYANYFNTTPNTVTSGVTQICVETGNDGFIRHGTAAAVRTFLGVNEAGSIPQNIEEGTSAYTLVASDAGKHVYRTNGNIVVPQDVFDLGDAVTIYNAGSASRTISQGTGVDLRIAGSSSTGNVTLAGYGLCTILKVKEGSLGVDEEFIVSGTGVS